MAENKGGVRDLLEGRSAGAQNGFNMVRKQVSEDEQIEQLEAAFGAGIEDAPIEVPEVADEAPTPEVIAPVAAAPAPAAKSALEAKLAKALGAEEAGELMSMLASASKGSAAANDELLLAKFARAYPEIKNPKVRETLKAMGGDFRANLTAFYGDRKAAVAQHLAGQMSSPRKGADKTALTKDEADDAAAAEFMASGDVNKALSIKAQLMGPQAATRSRFGRRGNLW